jgi:hypothetical protein
LANNKGGRLVRKCGRQYAYFVIRKWMSSFRNLSDCSISIEKGVGTLS